MTDEQRQKIRVLRYQGWSYERIAKEIDLSRDSIRSYCRLNGLNGLATDLQKNMMNPLLKNFLIKFA